MWAAAWEGLRRDRLTLAAGAVFLSLCIVAALADAIEIEMACSLNSDESLGMQIGCRRRGNSHRGSAYDHQRKCQNRAHLLSGPFGVGIPNTSASNFSEV